MNRLIALVLISLIASMLLIPPVQALESGFTVSKISYYGYIIDRNTEQPVDSAISITFRIYHDEDSGTPIWEESHSSVNVTEGVFDVSLGSNNALAGIDFDRDLWLGVEVNADGEMTPRHQLPNLESQIPAASNSANGEQKPEQIDFGQFGHAVIEISVDYDDIRSESSESSEQVFDKQSVNISPGPPGSPQLNTTSQKFDITTLQSIPVEEERIFDTEDCKVYSNSPRAPGK